MLLDHFLSDNPEPFAYRKLTVAVLPESAKNGAPVRPPENKDIPSVASGLADWNGFGGFTPDGREYVIGLEPAVATPAPWINVIANPVFGITMSESGSGFAWRGNSQQNRLTPWSNDPVSDPPGDTIYLRDEKTGDVWTPTASPIRGEEPYVARHGQGYSVFEHTCWGIEQELLVFVPNEDGIGSPVKVQRLRLTNHSGRPRTLSATAYAEWTLGVNREFTRAHITTRYDAESRSIQATNPSRPIYGNNIAFLAASEDIAEYTASRNEFIGSGTLAEPESLFGQPLGRLTGTGLDPCAAIRVPICLDADETKEIIFLLGEGDDRVDVAQLVERFSDRAEVQRSFDATRQWWDNILGAITVSTPDSSTDRLLNRWLLYQDLSCRIWGRSAFYQSGGAFGFRDQLQDMMALVYASPALAREHILTSAARQFEEGDVQHWWHPDTGIGVRTRMSDDLVWLPFVTGHYVRVTGDWGILDEQISFLTSSVLSHDEHERVEEPAVSSKTATLLEHCMSAIERGATRGVHGLPLIGGGDWNDGFNKVGAEGKGESVWLAWFLIAAMQDMSELLVGRGRDTEAEQMLRKADEYTAAIEEHCWDGEWYIRAFFDNGLPLGSKESDEAKIDSLAQSWAVISGAGDPVRARTAINSAVDRLVNDAAGAVMLFTPPFDKTPNDPGYIKGYLPGVRENGGQYTHGSLWLPMAFARCGDGDTAVKLLQIMSPVNHSKTQADAVRYAVEPYVVAADIYSESTLSGRGGWTWYTGSAGWMYRVWIEEVLGFRKRGETLEIVPAIPKSWPGYRLTFRHRTALYEVAVENPKGEYTSIDQTEMDGKVLPESKIPLVDDGLSHSIRILLG